MSKKYKQAHSMNKKFGMGHYYGQAIPAKLGKNVRVYAPGVNPATPKKLRKPPKTLA